MGGGRMEILSAALNEGRTVLSEHESCAIPVTREKEAYDEKDFRAALEEIGFPLVIKACGPNVTHKTERGLVHLDVRTRQEAVAAFKKIMQEGGHDVLSVIVQEMVKGSRELVIGLTRDVQFGPCVMFGLGGIFTEVLRDISFRVAPIDKPEALEMMASIKGRKILEPFRGMPGADLDQLADILIKVGNLGVEQARIKEIDINPLILSGSKPVAVDALIVLEPAFTIESFPRLS
jgi:acyl-CoA synthetase (NDP forming)